MSYCMFMKSANFFIPAEYAGIVLAKTDLMEYSFELDPDGNIMDIEFIGEKLYDDFSIFQAIAPYVKDGSYIEMMGEDGEQWRWVFQDGECQEIKATVSWSKI